MIERFLEIKGEDIKIVSYAFNHSFLSMESNKGLTLLSFLELREYTEDEKTEKAIYWTQGTFKDKLPKPKAQVIKKDYIDNKKSFSFVACGLTKNDYDSYVEKCKKMGYTVDADSYDDFYYAKNSEGYKIDIRYDEDDFELNVTISAPSTNTTDTTDDDQEIDEED